MFRPYKTDFELCPENKDYIELPIEIFRMKDSGITVYGDDIIGKIETPSKDDVLAFQALSDKLSEILAELDPERHAQYLKTCQNPPVRLIAQIVLTRAMLDYYFITGKSCSSKAKIAGVMSNEVPGYLFQELLNLSYKWRYYPDRYEYIDGEIYLLASPKTSHQVAMTKLFGVLINWFEGKKVYAYSSAL